MIAVQNTTKNEPLQLELPDPPSDLAQRLSRIYDRAVARFREHENAQHARVVRSLEGLATVQSATVGDVLCKRVIICDSRDLRREQLISEIADRFGPKDNA